MNIVEAIAWATVELSSDKPDLKALRAVLDEALIKAVKLELSHEARALNLARLARAVGGPDGTI